MVGSSPHKTTTGLSWGFCLFFFLDSLEPKSASNQAACTQALLSYPGESQYHVVVLSSHMQQKNMHFFKARIYSFGEQLFSLILIKLIARAKEQPLVLRSSLDLEILSLLAGFFFFKPSIINPSYNLK